MLKKIIFYIILIVIILVAVFFSQQMRSGKANKNLVSGVTDQAGAYLAKGSSWIISKIYPKISTEVQNGGAAVSNGISDTTKKMSENISTAEKNVVNYFSEIADSIAGKNNDTCK